MSRLSRIGSYLLMIAAMSACGKQEQQLHVEPPKQTTAPAPQLDLPMPRLFQIAESRLRTGPGYAVDLLIDGEWTSFFAELPAEDLTGYESSLFTGSGFSGALTCLNRDCSYSTVDVSYEEKKSSLTFRSQKMRPIAGELQRDCEIPIFFEYEIERIFQKLPRLELDLQYLREMKPIRVTHVTSELWNGEETESLRAEVDVEDFSFELTDQHMREQLHRLRTKGTSPLFAKSFSYGLAGAGGKIMLTYIRAHYPWKGGGGMKELCYQTHLIPELLEGRGR